MEKLKFEYNGITENLIEIVLAWTDMARVDGRITEIRFDYWKPWFVDWANEFEEMNKETDWFEKDYLTGIYEFAIVKIKEKLRENERYMTGDIEPVITEAVECCPYCGSENVYPNYNVTENGYVVTCQHCGEKIHLCDECMHADDNSCMKCDWHEIVKDGTHSCFRGTIYK